MNLEPPLPLRKRSFTTTIPIDELNRTRHSKTSAASFFLTGATTPKLDRDNEDKTTEEPTSIEIRNGESDWISVDSQSDDPVLMEEIAKDMEEWSTRGKKLAAHDIMRVISIWQEKCKIAWNLHLRQKPFDQDEIIAWIENISDITDDESQPEL
ncbi:hypothetical protein V501_00504 [Pseudogymnoascus sp. VKM F-4519 (FW-2642)]|nr:hypothetical protein V501_00504 [Pseudogymnoascus sp. VKM F-4519 (FW-2642)]